MCHSVRQNKKILTLQHHLICNNNKKKHYPTVYQKCFTNLYHLSGSWKKNPEETKNIQNAEAWTFLKKDDFRCAISKTFTK